MLKPVTNSSLLTARPIYVDTKGSGVADHIAIDTTGDGVVDTLIAARPGDIHHDIDTVVSLPVDTVGDGKADHVAIDTTGDGRVDTILKMPSAYVSTDKLPQVPPPAKIPGTKSWGVLPQIPMVHVQRGASMPVPRGPTRGVSGGNSPKAAWSWDWAPSVKSDFIAHPERQVVAEIPDDVLDALKGLSHSPQQAPRGGPSSSTLPSVSLLPVAMNLSQSVATDD